MNVCGLFCFLFDMQNSCLLLGQKTNAFIHSVHVVCSSLLSYQMLQIAKLYKKVLRLKICNFFNGNLNFWQVIIYFQF